MRLRGFLFGLGGGVIGTVLVVVVLLAIGALDIKPEKTVIQQVTTSPSTSVTTVSNGGLSPAQIYQKDAKSVVEIVSTFPGQQTFFGNSGSQQGIGSGFVVSTDGYILTNAHVVVNFDSTLGSSTTGTVAQSVTVAFKSAGKSTVTVPAKIIGTDTSNDVAVLKIDPAKVPTLTPIQIGDPNQVSVGDPVVAIGNPLGYDFSLSAGVISAVGRTIDAPNGSSISDAIQTDAAINPGNSGGPLIDSQGAVIGINDQIATSSGTNANQGVGFAVPVNTAMTSLQQIRDNGGITWLGIQGLSLTSDVAKALNLKQTQGVLVEDVVPNSPASQAGLQAGNNQVTVQGQTITTGGDIITSFDGTQVTSMKQLVGLIAGHKRGDKVSLVFLRNGKSMTVEATLEIRPLGT
jgi:S1-C subfamily serine protease